MRIEGFADRIDDELRTAPPAPTVQAHVASGRRALRRRRVVNGAGALAVAMVIAGGAFAVTDLGGKGSADAQVATSAQPTAAEIVARCDGTQVSDGHRERLFGPGEPEVLASATSSLHTRAVLRSADGRYWGDCMLRNDEGGEFDSGLSLYSAEPERGDGYMFGYGPGCPLGAGETQKPGCDLFSFHMVDRRPPEVAEVEVVTADGQATRVRTNEGYFAIEVVGRLPEGVSLGVEERGFFEPMRSLAFYDASGKLLAVHHMKGPRLLGGGDPTSIDEYPSLAGDPL
jgi:hypothetical protein